MSEPEPGPGGSPDPIGEASNGVVGEGSVVGAPPQPSASPLAALVLRVEADGLSPRTRETYAGTAKRFLAFLAARGKGIETAGSTEAAEFIAAYRERYRLLHDGKEAPIATLRIYTASVAALYRAVGRPVDSTFPHQKSADPSVHFLSPEQARTLLIESYRDPLEYAVVATLLGTGLRVSEACGVTRESLYPEEGRVFVPKEIAKGAKSRNVYRVPPWVFGAINEFLRDPQYRRDDRKATDPLFGIGVDWVEVHVRSLARVAELPAWTTPHKLRHTWATALLNAGVDLRRIQLWAATAVCKPRKFTSTTAATCRATDAAGRSPTCTEWTRPSRRPP